MREDVGEEERRIGEKEELHGLEAPKSSLSRHVRWHDMAGLSCHEYWCDKDKD